MNPTTLTELALTIFAISWRTSLLIVPLILLRLVTRRKMPAQLMFVAWVIVAVRLLLPFSMPTSWSPFNWLARVSKTISAKPMPIHPKVQREGVDHGGSASRVIAPDIAAPVAAPIQRQPSNFLAFFWAGGIALLIGLRVVAAWRFRRRLRAAVPLIGTRVDRLLSEELTFPVFRRPRCYLTDSVSAPALFGLLRPRLLFPPGLTEKLTDNELRLVLRHELGHWHRHDLLALGVIHLAVVVHWFNPFVWLAAWFARIDCELGCDEFVLGRKNKTDAPAYAATLLKVLAVTPAQPSTLGAVALLESKRRLLERVSAIADFRGFGVARVTASVIVLLALGMASMTREAIAADRTPTATPSPATIPVTPAANAPAATRPATFDQQEKMEARKEANQLIKSAAAYAEQLKSELTAAEIRAQQIKDYQATGRDLATLPFFAAQPLVVQLRQTQTDQRLQLANLSLRYAERHPNMIRARNELELTERELASAIDDLCRQVEAQRGTSMYLYQAAERELQRRQQVLRNLDESQGDNFGSRPAAATKTASHTDEYVLRPSDRLRVEVFQEPDLGRERQISPDGTVMLPLIGTTELSGKTISQAEDYVREQYRQKRFLLDPRVAIGVVNDSPEARSQEPVATSSDGDSYTLVARETVFVRVARLVPPDTDGETLFKATLAKGERQNIPWNESHNIWASAGENLAIEFRGKVHSLGEYFTGYGHSQMIKKPVEDQTPKSAADSEIAEASRTVVISLDAAGGIANPDEVRNRLAAIRKVSDSVRLRISRPDSDDKPFDRNGPAIRWIYATVGELDLELVELTDLSLMKRWQSRNQN